MEYQVSPFLEICLGISVVLGMLIMVVMVVSGTLDILQSIRDRKIENKKKQEFDVWWFENYKKGKVK